MPKNRYYYYDHESCAFVELKATRTKLYVQVAGLAVAALMLAGAITWGLDHLIETPQELALKAENDALQAQLVAVGDRMAVFSDQLSTLADTDQNLYRNLLQAEPISKDVRQVGVGGADPYADFNRFGLTTASLLKQTASQIGQLERQIGLQRESYRELSSLAETHKLRLAQMPAILPADGPVISSFKMRDHPILRIKRMHYGIDILVPTGTPVVSTGDGMIKETGKSASFGNFVKVDHPISGYITVFAHLSKIPRQIQAGRKVSRGELIGYSGNSGLSKAPHLHYEVHDLEGRALNPIYFFAPSMTPSQYNKLLEASERSTVSFD